jgi:TonB family protein
MLITVSDYKPEGEFISEEITMIKHVQNGNNKFGLGVIFGFLALMIALPLKGAYAEADFSVPSDTSKVYNVVDEMPEINGGVQAIYKHISYPSTARRRGIEGRVFIQFIVDEQGNVQEPTIMRDIGGGCGEAAVEAIQKVTFTPGRHKGKTVKVRYSLPITFKLES